MPRLAMSGSLVLGLVRAGLLIYFIHHLAWPIQIDAIMGQVERGARWVIDDLYPNGSGYLQLSSRAPHPAAARQDIVVWLTRQVGDHVVAARR